MMTFEFLDVGCGDGIHIRWEDTTGITRNILIDGGTVDGDIYPRIWRKKIEEIVVCKKEQIDIWIITHIDDDHIGGVLRLLKDEELLQVANLSRTTFWFNYSIWDYDTGIGTDDLKSVKQGIFLRDYLLKHGKAVETITSGLGTIELWGARFTILSPDQKAYDRLLRKWEKEERKIKIKEDQAGLKKASKSDYGTVINDFDVVKDDISVTEENASSIAMLVEYNKKFAVLCADGHPKIISRGISGYTDGKKIKLDFMQVPHHGSKHNISNSLIDIVDCEKYVLTADGYNSHNLPNKVTMAKILSKSDGRQIGFYITQENEVTRKIFNVDGEIKATLNFPEQADKPLIFTL